MLDNRKSLSQLMKEHADDPNVIEAVKLFAQLDKGMAQIKARQEKKEQERMDDQIMQDLAIKKERTQFEEEIKELKDEIKRKNYDLEDMRRRLEQRQAEAIVQCRQEWRRLEQVIAEKQGAIDQLARQLNRQKQRNMQLEDEVLTLSTAKDSLEHSFIKSTEMIKSHVKEINGISEEIELEKFMSQSTYKQSMQKINSLVELTETLQKKKVLLEDKFEKQRAELRDLRDRSQQLELELEKEKEMSWRERQHLIEQYERRLAEVSRGEKKINDGKLSKVSQYSEPMASVNPQKSSKSSLTPRLPILRTSESGSQMQTLRAAVSEISKQTSSLARLKEAINKTNEKIKSEEDVWAMVVRIREENKQLKDELNELKQRENPHHADELLKKDHPAMYQYFQKKMEEVEEFEQRLGGLEKGSEHIIEMMERLLIEGVPQNKNRINEDFEQKEMRIRSKMKKEFDEILDKEKDNQRRELRQMFDKDMNAVREEIIIKDKEIKELEREVKRLKDKNEDLKRLMQESEQAKLNEKILIPKMQIEEGNTGHQMNSTPSIHKEETKESNSEYWKSQVTRLQLQVDNYKKEIRNILENYKIKNTKMRPYRCNQCYFRIDGQELKKCEKCNMELHENCRQNHDKKCVKKKVGKSASGSSLNSGGNNGNNAKKKKPSCPINNSNKELSQPLDYF